MQYRILGLAAPSGTGKTTIIERLLAEAPSLRLSRSLTTRAIREGEVDGVHYDFVTREVFRSFDDAGELAEKNEFAGNLYGTPKRQLDGDDFVLVDADCNGMRQLGASVPNFVSVFIYPRSPQVLEGRLRQRGTNTDEEIAQRMLIAFEEMKRAEEFDYHIMNHDLEHTLFTLHELIRLLMRGEKPAAAGMRARFANELFLREARANFQAALAV